MVAVESQEHPRGEKEEEEEEGREAGYLYFLLEALLGVTDRCC